MGMLLFSYSLLLSLSKNFDNTQDLLFSTTGYTYTTVAIFGLSAVSTTFNSKRSAPLNSVATATFDVLTG